MVSTLSGPSLERRVIKGPNGRMRGRSSPLALTSSVLVMRMMLGVWLSQRLALSDPRRRGGTTPRRSPGSAGEVTSLMAGSGRQEDRHVV